METRLGRLGFLECLQTVAVLLASVNAGVNLGIFNPTLPDIGRLTSSTTFQMSTTLTITGIASIVGAVAFGPLFDRFNGLLVLSVALLFEGVTMGLAPWFPHLIGYQIMVALSCMFNFGILAGCFSENCKTWRKQPKLIGPVIQLTDLLHVLGIAISPQIVSPFIGRFITIQPTDPPTSNETTITTFAQTPYPSTWSYYASSTTYDTNQTSQLTTTVIPVVDRSRAQPIQIGYTVVGVFDVGVAVVCLAAYIASLAIIRRRRLNYCRRLSTRRRSCTLNEEDLMRIAKSSAVASAATDTATKDKNDPQSGETQPENDTRPVLRRSRSLEKFQMMCSHPLVWDIPLTIDGRRPKRVNGSPLSSGPSSSNSLTTTAGGAAGAASSGALSPSLRNPTAVFLFTLIVLFFVMVGAREGMLTMMLFSYVTVNLHWPNSSGTLLLTVYQITRVVVHAAVVAVAGCVSAAGLTVANVVVLVASGAIMLATAGLGPIYFAIGVVFGAVATSNVLPTSLTLARVSVEIDGRLTGVLIAAIALGQSIVSPITGHLIDGDSSGGKAFPALILILSIITVVLLIPWMSTAWWLRRKRRSTTPPPSGTKLAAGPSTTKVGSSDEVGENSPLLPKVK